MYLHCTSHTLYIYITHLQVCVEIVLNLNVYVLCFGLLCILDMCVEKASQPQKEKEVEAFQLSEEQQNLIREDQPNKKSWDEAMDFLLEGPVCTPFPMHFLNSLLYILNSSQLPSTAFSFTPI